MRTAYIQSKVRPVKKLFIIELNDYEAFSKAFLAVQREIDGIFNLLFVNDDDLWSVAYKEFANRNDVDIIINFSKLSNNQLSTHFGILSIDPKDQDYVLRRYGTSLDKFTRHPFFTSELGIEKDENWLMSADSLTNTPFSLASCVNFGFLENIGYDLFEDTIFDNTKIQYLGEGHLFSNMIFSESKFCHITTKLGSLYGTCYGVSINETNYNKEKIFEDSRTYIFISKINDFKTISYFWNTRLYYHRERLAWFPIDFLDKIQSIVDSKTVFVCLTKDTEQQIGKLY